MTTDTDKPQAPMNARETLLKAAEICAYVWNDLNRPRRLLLPEQAWQEAAEQCEDRICALAAEMPQGEAGVPEDVAKDAARYRWLCEANDGCYWDIRYFVHSKESKWHWLSRWKMDAAIDAAMLAAVPAAPNRTICICGVSFTVGDTEMIAFHKDCHKARFIHRSPAAPKEKP